MMRRTDLFFLFCVLYCARFDDAEVQRDKKLYPYRIINKNNKPYIEVEVKGEKQVCADVCSLFRAGLLSRDQH